ncbi:MAG: glycosyltransferase [Chloroflexota bacterium]
MSHTRQGQRRRHIGLVTPGFSASDDDWCIPALLTLVRHLVAHHDVTVYTLRYPHQAHTYQVSGARVRSFGGATAGGWRRLPLLWRAIRTIVGDARQKPFALLHGLWADEAGFVAGVAARRCAVPSLVSLMGGELVRLPEAAYGVQLSRSGRFLTGASLRLANLVTAGSRQLLDRATSYVTRDRLRRAPLGVDLSLFRPGPSSDDPGLRIVHAASLTAVKDQETLLGAFTQVRRALPETGISLHIAGDGPLLGTLKRRAERLDMARFVHFHGAISHERMPDFYRLGDLFVLSSLYESQSVAILEAAACGLPAVGTAVGLLPELLPESLLANPRDEEELARAMLSLLEHDRMRREEAQRIQSRVSTSYRLEATIPRLLAIYDELMTEAA